MTNDDLALCHSFASAAGIDRERVLDVERELVGWMDCANDPMTTSRSFKFTLHGALTENELIRAAKAMMSTLFPDAGSWLTVRWADGHAGISCSRADVEKHS